MRSIPPEIQKQILAMQMDSIDAMNGQHRQGPPATRWDPETVIDDEDM
jgi:hypothetical protein